MNRHAYQDHAELLAGIANPRIYVRVAKVPTSASYRQSQVRWPFVAWLVVALMAAGAWL